MNLECPMTRLRLRPRRGFTLIELMIAITIVAVLATLAAVALGPQVRKGRLAEMENVLLSAATAQEAFVPHITNPSPTWCPQAPANVPNRRMDWDVNCDNEVWPILRIEPSGGTWFSYYSIAGGPGDTCTPPSDPTGTDIANLCTALYAATGNAPGGPVGVDWWALAAVADQDGDDNVAVFYTSSEIFPAIVRDNELE